MFDSFVPRLKIGCLMPGDVIDNHAFEFYRLAPPGVMLVMVGVGLKEFSSADVERVFAPLESYLDQLMDRGVDMVTQNGVPLPIQVNFEASYWAARLPRIFSNATLRLVAPITVPSRGAAL